MAWRNSPQSATYARNQLISRRRRCSDLICNKKDDQYSLSVRHIITQIISWPVKFPSVLTARNTYFVFKKDTALDPEGRKHLPAYGRAFSKWIPWDLVSVALRYLLCECELMQLVFLEHTKLSGGAAEHLICLL